jgi:hypothetical protein
MLSRLSDGLGATTNNIRVVGSAKTGFSLNPDAFPRSFSEHSDIDVFYRE